MTTLTHAHTEVFSTCKYPVLDRRGRRFDRPCRVRVCEAYYYINTRTFTGTLLSINAYGGMQVLADEPQVIYGRGGFQVGLRRDLYVCVARYDYARHAYAATTHVGDPFEHGQRETYVEILDEPYPTPT